MYIHIYIYIYIIRQPKLTVRIVLGRTPPHGAVPGPGTPHHGAVPGLAFFRRPELFSAAGLKNVTGQAKTHHQPGQKTSPARPNNITGQATKHHPGPGKPTFHRPVCLCCSVPMCV